MTDDEAAFTDTAFADSLARLHTRLVDAANGFDTATDKAEPEIATPLRELAALHRDDAEALADLLAIEGRRPDADGSFMTVVHRTIFSVRALFDRLGEEALPPIISGEQAILELYDDALAAAGPGLAHERRVVAAQRRRLAAAVASLDRMAA